MDLKILVQAPIVGQPAVVKLFFGPFRPWRYFLQLFCPSQVKNFGANTLQCLAAVEIVESRQRREVGQIVHRNHLVQEVPVPPGPHLKAHFKGARKPLGLGVQAPLHLWAKVNFYPNLGTFRPTFMTFKARLLVVLGHLELSLQPLQQPRRLAAIASREINEGVF